MKKESSTGMSTFRRVASVPEVLSPLTDRLEQVSDTKPIFPFWAQSSG